MRSSTGRDTGAFGDCVSVEAARRLGEMSARWGLPVKSLLLAANCVAVGAAWETETPAVGLLLDGRPERTGADVTLCLFLNQLPMRLDLRDADWRTAARRALDAENALLRTAHRRPAPLPAPDAAFDVRVRVPVPPASQLPGQSAITPCFTGSWRIARDIVATSVTVSHSGPAAEGSHGSELSAQPVPTSAYCTPAASSRLRNLSR